MKAWLRRSAPVIFGTAFFLTVLVFGALVFCCLVAAEGWRELTEHLRNQRESDANP